MILLYTGIMGSGKSYGAVYRINEKKQSYHHIYNNIQGYKFDQKVLSLSLDDFFVMLHHLKSIYIEGGDDDQVVIDYLIEENFLSIDTDLNIIPSLIVIDEAQKRLGTQRENQSNRDIFIWFATLHRHFFLDVILITQSHKLIDTKLHPLIEEFHSAIPASRVIFSSKRFKYQKHMAVPYSKDTLVGSYFLKKDPKIFALYTSGDKVRSKSIIQKYIIYFILAIVVAFSLGSYFIDSLTHHSKENNQPEKIDISQSSRTMYQNNKKSSKIIQKYKNLKYIELECLSKICENKFYNIKLHELVLSDLLDKTGSKQLQLKYFGKNNNKYYLLISEDFYKLFTKEKGEKLTNISIF